MRAFSARSTDEELSAWLADDDARSRSYRVARLRLLLEQYGAGAYRMFPGGLVSLWAFEEARLAYLHGLYLGCILLSQTCIERMLGSIFRMAGRDDLDRAGYAVILNEARKQGFVTESEFALFNRLREVRNPYAHHRPPLASRTLESRAMKLDVAPPDLLEDDATGAITALLHLCARHPFAVSSE